MSLKRNQEKGEAMAAYMKEHHGSDWTVEASEDGYCIVAGSMSIFEHEHKASSPTYFCLINSVIDDATSGHTDWDTHNETHTNPVDAMKAAMGTAWANIAALYGCMLDNENKVGKIKYVPVSELLSAGYIQETNRNFLHPLAMAIEVLRTNGDDRLMMIRGVRDYRFDPEGVYFDFDNVKAADVEDALQKAEHVQDEWDSRIAARASAFNAVMGIEQLPKRR